MTRARAARLAAVALALATVSPGAGPVAASALASPVVPDDDPLLAAAKAAEEVSFVGVLQVRWSERAKERSETLLVQGGNGSVVVRGGTAAMASPNQRLVEHTGGEWDLLWPSGNAGVSRPAPSLKYQLATAPGPLVTGRPTRLVEARRDGTLLDRLYLDEETRLLLRREQFEDGATPSRTMTFETLTISPSAPPPSPPTSVVDAKPVVMSAGRMPSGVSAPSDLAGGYERVGLYRRSAVVHAVYSDGLYNLSLFQQRGRLINKGSGADRVTIGSDRGSHYVWAGGHVVLWEHGGTVFTAVSDAPLGQLVTALASLPSPGDPISLVRRLRQVCRALVQPLAA